MIIQKIKNKLLNRLINRIDQHNRISKSAKIGDNIKISGSRLGANVSIGQNSSINNSQLKGNINLGENAEVNDSFIKGDFKAGENAKLHKCKVNGKSVRMGRFSSLWGPNLDLTIGKDEMTIGNFCSIARNVSIQSYNHNFKKITSYYIGQNLFKERWENETVYKSNPLTIKNDVWIGTHCVILGGVTIHNGAVVAANSVVSKDVPPYSIVAGTPAKVIGYRFDKETIEYLQDLQWWDWDLDKIKSNKELFFNELDVKNLPES